VHDATPNGPASFCDGVQMAENLDELRERAELLSTITKMEDDAEWTDLDELRERAAPLTTIQKAEE
jgi:hypothetical protein